MKFCIINKIKKNKTEFLLYKILRFTHKTVEILGKMWYNKMM